MTTSLTPERPAPQDGRGSTVAERTAVENRHAHPGAAVRQAELPYRRRPRPQLPPEDDKTSARLPS